MIAGILPGPSTSLQVRLPKRNNDTIITTSPGRVPCLLFPGCAVCHGGILFSFLILNIFIEVDCFDALTFGEPGHRKSAENAWISNPNDLVNRDPETKLSPP